MQALYAAVVVSSSSRCLCDGQYLLPGSGTRWHEVPLRVVAWQHSGLPSKVTPDARLGVHVLGCERHMTLDHLETRICDSIGKKSAHLVEQAP